MQTTKFEVEANAYNGLRVTANMYTLYFVKSGALEGIAKSSKDWYLNHKHVPWKNPIHTLNEINVFPLHGRSIHLPVTN